jgi:putative ABC transport system permease protein
MNKWLQTFAYATTIGIDVMLIAGAVAVLAALAAILWQTFKAARANPVKALKYE